MTRQRPRERSFALDGRSPAAIRKPAGADELAAALRDADAGGKAVIAFGGGTLQGIGNPPRRYDEAISTERLNGIFDYDPRDLTVGAGAGTTVAKLNAALARERQFVPFDVPSAARATVGGTLAGGWLGPRRSSYGRLRDLLIGTTTALADGTLAHAGGMVVKNVSGYDLSKLYVGSLGTLGILVRANFKALPLPRVFRLAVAPLPEGTRARALDHVRALDVEPTCALACNGFREVLPFEEGPEGALVLIFEGSERAVERGTRGMRSALGAAGVPETRIVDAGAQETFARILEAYVAPVPGRSVTLRALGLPDRASARAEAARAAIAPTAALLDTILDLRHGDLIARIFVDGALDELAVRGTLADAIAALREALPEATILARDVALDGEIDAWGAPPSALETMRALKDRFDPKRTLAPGRYVGGI